jgi:hypothetical protein
MIGDVQPTMVPVGDPLEFLPPHLIERRARVLLVCLGVKHKRAKALVEELWDTRSGVISTRVLYSPLGPVSPNPAPAGSVAMTIHSPVGTSWGPMSILPPLVSIARVAAAIDGTPM